MRKMGLLSVVILCLLSLSPVPALAQGDGLIQGRVVNGTAGGGSTEGLQVTLRVFHGQSEAEPLITTTNAQGRFRFESLAVNSDSVYLSQVSYRDVVYSTGLLTFKPGDSEIMTEIPVYETTTDDEGIVVERAHILINVSSSGLGQSASLLVTELHVFFNPGDQTFIGREEVQGRRAVSRFLLPQGSYNWAFDDGSLGGRFLAINGGFVDTEPLWPGMTSVIFRYVLDCKAGDCSLTRDVTRLTPNLNLLIADTGARVESDRLALEGKVDAEGQHYLNYVAHNLVPGERLELHVRLPQVSPAPVAYPKSNSSILPWITLGGVVTVLVLAYPFWRQRVRASAQEESHTPMR